MGTACSGGPLYSAQGCTGSLHGLAAELSAYASEDRRFTAMYLSAVLRCPGAGSPMREVSPAAQIHQRA